MGSESLCLMSILSYLRSSSNFSVLSHKWKKKFPALGKCRAAEKGNCRISSFNRCTWLHYKLKHHDIGIIGIIGITASSSPWPSRPFRCWTTQRPLRWALAHGGTRPEALSVSKTDMRVTCVWHACDMHDIPFTLSHLDLIDILIYYY